MSKDHPLYSMSRQFQLDPSPVFFSPALDGDEQAKAEIINLIKAGEPNPMMPYNGRVDHSNHGLIEWMIYVLPKSGIRDIHQAMGVRLADEWWSPDFLRSECDQDG